MGQIQCEKTKVNLKNMGEIGFSHVNAKKSFL